MAQPPAGPNTREKRFGDFCAFQKLLVTPWNGKTKTGMDATPHMLSAANEPHAKPSEPTTCQAQRTNHPPCAAHSPLYSNSNFKVSSNTTRINSTLSLSTPSS